jgi:putative transposase
VLFKAVYVLVCRVFSLVVLVFRADLAKDAELLVLRHENEVLRRQAAGCGTSQLTGPGSPRWPG